MSESPIIKINANLSIPRAELSYRASRSGGPGGQHANTSSTRVELLWDVGESPSLSSEQRERLREKLSSRINADGVLLMAESGSRSQHQNKKVVTDRFRDVLRGALRRKRRRIPTRPTRASKERRLKQKKHRAELKKTRRSVDL